MSELLTPPAELRLPELPGRPAVQVTLLPSPAGIPDSLTYLVPQSLRDVVTIGTPVLVPLGGREHLGYVVAVGDEAELAPQGLETEKLRPLLAVPRPDAAFDAAMIELLRGLAR